MEFDIDSLRGHLGGDEHINDVLASEIEEHNKRIEIASIYHHTFATDSGRKCLQHMINAFLASPTVIPTESQEANGIREGRKRVVFLILQLMNMHETGDYRDVDT